MYNVHVRNMMLHANAATLRGLTYFIFGLYDVVSGNHSVQNSPWGRGSIASAGPRELYFTFCVIWGYRVQHLITQKEDRKVILAVLES